LAKAVMLNRRAERPKLDPHATHQAKQRRVYHRTRWVTLTAKVIDRTAWIRP
jgi:hypothetical protein